MCCRGRWACSDACCAARRGRCTTASSRAARASRGSDAATSTGRASRILRPAPRRASRASCRASPSSCSRSARRRTSSRARDSASIRARRARVAKIGGTKDPDLARLRALAPTHVVVNVDENRREDVDAMREFVPHVIVTHPLDAARQSAALRAVRRDLRTGASAPPRSPRSSTPRSRRRRTSTRALPREPVLYLIWRKPWMTVSRDTYVSATLARSAGTRCRRRGEALSRARGRRRCVARGVAHPAVDRAVRVPRARRREMKERHGKPVTLVDGEWTSWYGPRASGSRASRTASAAKLRRRREPSSRSRSYNGTLMPTVTAQ